MKIKLKDFTRYKFLSGIKFSPKGRRFGFLVHEIDLEGDCYKSNLWVSECDDKESLTGLTDTGDCKSFSWLSEEEVIVQVEGSKEGTSRLLSINPVNKKTRQFADIPVTVQGFELIDGNNVLLKAPYQNQGKPYPNSFEGVEVFDELPFWENGKGIVNKKRTRAYVYSIEENKLSPITGEYFELASMRLSAEKDKVLYFGTEYKNKRGQRHDLLVYDIAKKETTNIFGGHLITDCDFFGDGAIVASSDMKEYGLYENPNFYLVGFDGSVEMLANNDFALANGTSSDCTYGGGNIFEVSGDAAYYISTVESYSVINRVDAQGKAQIISPKNGSVECFDIFGDKIVFVGMASQALEEVYLLDVNTKVTQKFSDFNTEILRDKDVVIPEKVVFTNKDGVDIEGWVMEPVGLEAGAKYPGILNIHGGPKGVYSAIHFHEMQLWANSGYFVFFCNPRGSTGRGDEFTDLRGKYGTVDYTDIMEFTDYVLENYSQIDKNRLGVAGGSYGGFMTNWVIGHTSRFKAAASQRSISNWISDFGTTDIGYFFNEDEHVVNPWNGMEKLWEMSPLKHACNASTPTLFIHSEEDYRCSLSEGLQMFTALKYFGVEARMVVFKGENHNLSRSGKPKNRIRRLEEILRWFDMHLKAE